MKLSIARASIFRHFGDEYDFYRRIKAAGFNYVDYDFYNLIGDENSRYTLPDWENQMYITTEKMNNIGIKAIISHAPKGEPARDRDSILFRSQRSLLCCGILGIPDMVIHPGGVPGWTQNEFETFNLRYIQDLLPYAEKSNTRILVENVGRWDEPFYVQRVEELIYLIDKVNHPLVKVCLDTGHLNIQNQDNAYAIRMLGDRLKGLHIQDNFGSLPIPITDRAWRQDLHLPPGFGCIDFDAIIKALVEIGYEGAWNMETETPRCFEKQHIGCPAPRLKYMDPELTDEYYHLIHDLAADLLIANDIVVE
jgi:sugar phosphate isomerase/epimerase